VARKRQDPDRLKDIRTKEQAHETFTESQATTDFFTQTKKERREQKDNLVNQGEKTGLVSLPAPESILPLFDKDPHVRNVVISSSKSVQDSQDFLIQNTSAAKRVIMKDLLQVLRDDSNLKNKALVYNLQNW
jgi:hypothetical protein